MRGENQPQIVGVVILIGTSPRARGKLTVASQRSEANRNIPACAGKTLRSSARLTVYPEHPRVRGENGCVRLGSHRICGTSPRARGKPAITPSSTAHDRNIPACAGKTQHPRPALFPPTEHPRVRGENGAHFVKSTGAQGTSPRARGKLVHDVLFVQLRRNIPACAGKTRFSRKPRSGNQEHPRVRGENPAHLLVRCLNTGTSPRARGKLSVLPTPAASLRNIPACAGKTRPGP